MRVEVGNMVFDDTDGQCLCILAQSEGKLFAFLQVLDLGAAHARFERSMTKRYWGEWDWDNVERSIRNIMEWGGKWPTLPQES